MELDRRPAHSTGVNPALTRMTCVPLRSVWVRSF